MLQALLSGGLQGGPPGPDLGPAGGGPPDGGDGGGGGFPADLANPDDLRPMGAVDHIRQAMKHLMMAMTQTQDEQQGHGITKGMSALQALLAGDAKQKLAARGG
jgi:hypothetical protein